MPNLYRLMSGKISRRNSNGDMEINSSPFDFVPTEAELKSNKDRLKLVGTVEDDDDAAIAALKNTNQAPKLSPTKKTTLPDNLSSIKDLAFITEVLSSVKDEEMLDKYLAQEVARKPARKSVIAAIEGRRDQLKSTLDKVLLAQ